MGASLKQTQLTALETTERVASCFSLVGTLFILITFFSSPDFRKPINRLVFYASWGNMVSKSRSLVYLFPILTSKSTQLCNVGTLMSESPIRIGPDSHLCQFQGFLIQM